MHRDIFSKIAQAPTNPGAERGEREFDVADLYQGPASGQSSAVDELHLDEKLRQAYFWMVNSAIISPYFDIEFNDRAPDSLCFGPNSDSILNLPSAQSYSSFVLLPLLNLIVRKRCLLVGGPGRGKTASAVLMGLLAGYSKRDVQRAIQHGQPQMTITDLLGNPLPKDLLNAEDMDEIRIAWRKWLGMRVKIIDEYNRIPTRTQSALLTVMGDNYAELMDQIYECPPAAWYLTANDDAGGGTYQVIEALRDRIDIVVKALHFSPRFLADLLARIEAGVSPEDLMPADLVFTQDQIDRMHADILAVPVPKPLLRRLEHFVSQFEFFDAAAEQFEYKTKDTVKLAGADFALLSAQANSTDKLADLGNQTRNGVSVRALMTSLEFVKAMAYFRGADSVSLEDLRQILPFTLHDKLTPHHESPFFEQYGNAALRVDRISWIRRLFDLSCAEYDRMDRDHDDPVGDLSEEFDRGLEGVSAQEVNRRLLAIRRQLTRWSSERVNGPLYDNVLKLKYLHQRYSNYLRWLEWQG